jgi:FKBP-type peptidyl-prolyl cis-trans isomerase 2
MKTIYTLAMAIMMATLTTACIKETESDFDLIVERDDTIVEQYLSSNGIDATKTQLGYYYRKDVENEAGAQFTNNDVIGIYYEIKTLEGHLIDSYLDENKPPLVFKYSNDGLWPTPIGFASGLARVGEEFTLYIPSYLAYNKYTYQQLITSGANLLVKAKYVRKYTEEQLKLLEDEKILAYIAENELEGFEKKDSGIYLRIVEEGEGEPSKNGNSITFSYKMFQLGIDKPISESGVNQNPTISLGSQNNMEYLNKSLVNLPEGTEVEVLAPSYAAFGETIQIVPQEIRMDLVTKGELKDIAAPYTPIKFDAEITKIQ